MGVLIMGITGSVLEGHWEERVPSSSVGEIYNHGWWVRTQAHVMWDCVVSFIYFGKPFVKETKQRKIEENGKKN